VFYILSVEIPYTDCCMGENHPANMRACVLCCVVDTVAHYNNSHVSWKVTSLFDVLHSTSSVKYNTKKCDRYKSIVWYVFD